MVLRISKNNRANEALAGAERGLARGMGLGLHARQIKNDETNDAFRREQILRHAQQVDQQLAREEQQRQATGEAAGEMAQTPQSPPMPNMPGMAQAGQSLAFKAQMQRVEKIARRMGETGSSPQEIRVFVESVREKHRDLLAKQDLEDFEEKAAAAISDSSLFGIGPDGTKTENPEIAKSVQKAIDIARSGDVAGGRVALADLKRNAAKGEARFRRKQGIKDWLEQQAAQIGANETQGPGGPDMGRAKAQHQQRAQMAKYASVWEAFSDDIESNPQAMEKFIEGVTDAAQWFTYVGGKRVRFEEAEKEQELQAAKAETEQMRAELLRIQAQTQAALGPLQADKMKAETDKTRQTGMAEMVRANAYAATGGARGNAAQSRKESPAQLRKMAIENVKAKRGTANMEDISEAEIQAEMRALSGEAVQAAGNTNASTGGNEVTPEQAAALGWSDEDWIEYEKTGAVPK